MKNLMLFGLVLFTASSYSNTNVGSELLAVATPTYTQVNKIKGGLFGYRSVGTSTDNNGNKVTVCQNPGLKRCAASAEIVVGETVWTSEQAEALDKFITEQLTPTHTSGTVLYNSQTVVTYTYNIDNNSLSYNVYSIQSATENGITW